MIEEQNINQLPKDWKWVKLGEVCLDKEGLRRGPFGSAIKKEFFVPSGYKVYEQSNAIYNDAFRGKYFLDEIKYQELINFNVQPGDLIVSCSGTLGRIAEIPTNAQPGVINQALLRVRLKEHVIEKKYFLYNFRSAQFQKKIFDQSQGTAMSNLVGIKDFKLIEIFVPSKPTQQVIVSKIEELFSELDKGIEQLKTAQQQLKTYRQAVLKWAFEGKLTSLNHNSYDLHNEHDLTIVAEPEVAYGNRNGLPKRWKKVKLGDIAKKNSIKALPVDYPDAKFIGMDCIEPHTLKPFFLYDFKEFKSAGNYFKKNQVLYGRMRPYLNKVYRAEFDGTCSGEFIILDCGEIFNPDLLKYILHSRGFVSFANSITTGDRPRISYEEIADYDILFPPIEEQNKIVQEIESRLSVADKMEESIKQSLQQAEALRQSILKKAFAGRLVTELPQQQTKIIPIERKVLAGWIIYMKHKEYNFGLTMFQKDFCLVEHFIQPEYEICYGQHRAGPYDREFTHAFRKEMAEEGWFTEETKHSLTKFIPGENVGKLLKQFPTYYRSKANEIKFVLNIMKDKTLDEAELIATIYAAWNNRLIKNGSVNANILAVDVFNWSSEKQKYSEQQIEATYKWIKEAELIPTGFGKIIDLENK